MPKIDWLWFIIGIVFALFIIPMIQAWFASRKGNTA
jgi:hypothetical protein